VSVSEPLARLAVRSIEDLVGLVPYLIGFHPEESLVAMVLENGRVAVTARIDLDAITDAGALDPLLARLFGRFPGAEAWFLAYTDDDDLAWQVLADCVELAGLVRLGRVLQVGSHRWRADCPDGDSGRLAGVSAAAAQAAVLGLPARSSRRELAVGIAGPPDAEVEALVREFDARSTELEAMGVVARRRLLKRLLAQKPPLAFADCVRLAVLVTSTEGQLAALRAIRWRNADQQLERWTQVVRHCLTGCRPVVLGLLGLAAWQTGDGALEVVCLEELEKLDRGSPVAWLLGWVNSEVVPPQEWEDQREAWLSAIAAELRAGDRPPSPPRR